VGPRLNTQRFYYVDERKADGSPIGTEVTAQAHADFFAELIDRTAGEVPFLATFVDGKGYVKF